MNDGNQRLIQRALDSKMNILTANTIELEKLRKFRKIFSDVSERDLEDDRGGERSEAKINAEQQESGEAVELPTHSAI